jgi:hypothetical protein
MKKKYIKNPNTDVYNYNYNYTHAMQKTQLEQKNDTELKFIQTIFNNLKTKSESDKEIIYKSYIDNLTNFFDNFK